MQETQFQSLGWGDSLEEGMATRSSILAWRIPWTEAPGGLQTMGSQSDTAEHARLLLLAALIVEAYETYSTQLLLSPTVCRLCTKHLFIYLYIYLFDCSGS